jgi:hypothetical protein
VAKSVLQIPIYNAISIIGEFAVLFWRARHFE